MPHPLPPGLKGRRPIFPTRILATAIVYLTVIYCGHIHAYMLYSSGPPRVVVTGGAGANPHLSEDAGGFYHFLRVTVNGDEVTEEVIPL